MKNQLLLFLLFIFVVSCKQETSECAELKELYYYHVEDSVTFKLHDMQYACGECMRFYNVDSVLYSKNGRERDYYNKEILIKYLKGEPKEPVYINNCSGRCTVHIYTGYFTRNGFGSMRMDVLDGEIFVDEKCCEEAN